MATLSRTVITGKLKCPITGNNYVNYGILHIILSGIRDKTKTQIL